MYREDYQRGGIRVVTASRASGPWVVTEITAAAVLLVAVSVLPYLTGFARHRLPSRGSWVGSGLPRLFDNRGGSQRQAIRKAPPAHIGFLSSSPFPAPGPLRALTKRLRGTCFTAIDKNMKTY